GVCSKLIQIQISVADLTQHQLKCAPAVLVALTSILQQSPQNVPVQPRLPHAWIAHQRKFTYPPFGAVKQHHEEVIEEWAYDDVMGNLIPERTLLWLEIGHVLVQFKHF